jgi:hypothetical protein
MDLPSAGITFAQLRSALDYSTTGRKYPHCSPFMWTEGRQADIDKMIHAFQDDDALIRLNSDENFIEDLVNLAADLLQIDE